MYQNDAHGWRSAGRGPGTANVRLNRQRGNALFIVLLIVLMVLGILALMVGSVNRASGEIRGAKDHLQRLYTAEAGIQQAVLDLSRGGTGNLGSEAEPLPFDDGVFWVSTVEGANDTFTLVSTCELHGKRRVLEVVLRRAADPFARVVYAGNEDDNPGFVFRLSGVGNNADSVIGDMYVGADVDVTGNATMMGMVASSGTISGVQGAEGVHEPAPYFASMNYSATSDVFVKEEFDDSGVFGSSPLGGEAWQLPETSPAHMLRKNPSDRLQEIMSTSKDDYFLEDPYEAVRADKRRDGSDAHAVSFLANPGGTDARTVFYIDGNLWIHNREMFSTRVTGPQGGNAKVTFAVRGNIYVSDSVFLNDAYNDGVAFVALKDPAVADSGNIFLGDALDQALDEVQAYLYAEGDIRGVRLHELFSPEVHVRGAVAAGGIVQLDDPNSTDHKKVNLEFDSRVDDGYLELPGIPNTSESLGFVTVSWREIGANGGVAAPQGGQTSPTGGGTAKAGG
ncbi:MAG TPA: type II secretion system protein [Planctomycetes bacterium]|nr:type II secretion system protein [Planctomycetota bacterium]